MTNCKYIVVRNEFMLNDKTRVSYGIAAIEDCDGVISVLKSISDISLDFSVVENLVNVCNAEELDPIHIEDVVNDFFAIVWLNNYTIDSILNYSLWFVNKVKVKVRFRKRADRFCYKGLAFRQLIDHKVSTFMLSGF